MRSKIILLAFATLFSGVAAAQTKGGKKKKKKAPPKEAPAAVEEAAPSSAPAAETAAPAETPTYKAAYGMAGCGLGHSLIKENNIMQIFAATTNGTSANQLFGITSGTSGCTPSKKALAMEQKVFIESNLVSLNREAVTGEGETLKAFADLLGCDAQEFGEVSKTHYGQIYQNAEATAILGAYKNHLADQCSRLI